MLSILSHWKGIVLLGLLIGIEVVAETFLKKASTQNTSGGLNWSRSLILGVVSYIIVAFLFYFFLSKFSGTFSIANIAWQVANILIITLISKFIFGDHINWIQWVGFVLLVFGFILSGMEGKTSYYKSTNK